MAQAKVKTKFESGVTGFYSAYFTVGPLCGYRQVYAEVGYKLVKTFDWASGVTVKMPLQTWLSLNPQPRETPRRKWVRIGVERVVKTKLIRAALRATKKVSHAAS